MSYAVQAHTGKNFTQLLQEFLTKPLGLTNFGASPGDDTKAVIPPGDNSWGSDYGDNAP
jgi:CubicO group peptidase (beta-lactamase class C family)